ncbi:hypothetical protein [Lentzea sp. NEAU-D7]|uniref:hypothetical protein n=1 Tax=Lentzea sp. NEAU-D7 TaxID=2994667 RepID=UPI00224AAB1C|nr:hypothetical protein [Lentzea sp. NEAU-D7]MCX2948986.1 hypothetical protein [Lentzea sp. NEAU-D7]
MIVYEAQRALHRATATFVVIVLLSFNQYLRPDITAKPGAPIEVGVVAPPAPTSAPPTTWRPR